MKIKIWGCRGSIPVPDSRMLKYGGDTTSIELIFDKKILVIDAGTGIRKLGDELIKRRVFDIDIFITHSHWDHIQGFPFFMPIYSKKTKINVFGYSNSYRQLKSIFTNQMSYEYFPVSFDDLKSKINFIENCPQEYAGWNIKIIQLNHPIFTAGIRIEKNKKSFVFITDNEIFQKNPVTTRDKFVEFCKDATYLIHDAQFTEQEYNARKGWGHSTFDQVMSLAKESGVENLGFFHHDPNRHDDKLLEIEKKSETYCKEKGYKFKVFAVRELDEIDLK